MGQDLCVGSPPLPGSRPCAGSSSGTPLPPLAALTGKLPFSGFPVCSLLLRPRGPPGLSPARRRPAPLGRGPGLSPDRLPPAFSPHPQVYMNAVWHGWAVPMFLFLAILRLSLNYLIARWVAASSCARAGRSPRAVLHAQRGPAEPALSRAGVCWVSAATHPHSQEGGWLEPKPRPPPTWGQLQGQSSPACHRAAFWQKSPRIRGADGAAEARCPGRACWSTRTRPRGAGARSSAAVPRPRASGVFPSGSPGSPSVPRLGGCAGSRRVHRVGTPHRRGLWEAEVTPQSEPRLHIRPERRPCTV